MALPRTAPQKYRGAALRGPFGEVPRERLRGFEKVARSTWRVTRSWEIMLEHLEKDVTIYRDFIDDLVIEYVTIQI